jgi:hypothetical protein
MKIGMITDSLPAVDFDTLVARDGRASLRRFYRPGMRQQTEMANAE